MAVSTALLVTVLSIIGSIDHSVDTVATGITGDAALEVSGATDTGFGDAVRSDIAAVAGVGAAVPLIQSPVTTPNGSVLLLGTDANAAALRSPLQDELRAQGAALPTVNNGVVAGPGTGLRTGQVLRLQDVEVTVAAVLPDTGAGSFNGGHYLLAPLPLAQQAAAKAGKLDSVLIVAAPGADRNTLRENVTRVVAGRAVVGAPVAERTKAGNGVTLIRFTALSAAGMTFLVSAFLIYIAMSMAIAGRRPRLSMLRAIGGTRRSIVGDLLLETAALALVGAAAGSVLGVFLGRFTIGQLPAVFLQSVTARVEFDLPIWVIPVAIVVAVAICLAAAGLAAYQVYRVSPVEALAPVGVSRAGGVRTWARVAAGVAALVLAIAAFVNAATMPGILANAGITTMFAAA
ncbi:MAG: ABC transporter permease, partial [Nocardia sp.]|nr:ABC transporter permease [Nocardia sp.]